MYLILILLLFTFAYSVDKYCIQLSTLGNLEEAKREFEKVKDFPLARVEKIGRFYVLRVGLYEDKKKALHALREVRRIFPTAFVRKCKFNKERIVLIRENKKEERGTAVKEEEVIVRSFKDIGFLTDDVILRGVYPSYYFYIPVYDGYKGGNVELYLRLSPELSENSYVEITLNGKPIRRFSPSTLPYPVNLKLPEKTDRDFIEIGVKGYLRHAKTICEDIYENRVYLIVEDESKLYVKYEDRGELYNAFHNYNPVYSIKASQNKDFYSLAFYLSKYVNLSPKIIFNGKEGFILVYDQKAKGIIRDENKLYVSDEFINSLKEGYFPLLNVGKKVKLRMVKSYTKKEERELLTLKDMGYETFTASGIGYVPLTFTFNYTYVKGIPKKPRLRLHIAHTPVEKNASVNVYVNGRMINSFEVRGAGEKSYDIPLYGTIFGDNTVSIILNDFISSDECYGNVPRDELTLFADSYIYWEGISREVSNVSDFIKLLSGRVLFVTDNDLYDPFLVKFLSELGKRNKNVERVDVTKKVVEPIKDYDFIVFFGKARAELPVSTEKGEFRIYDPLTGNLIFSSSYENDFILIQTGSYKNIPLLNIVCNGSCNRVLGRFSFESLYKLFANVGILTAEYELAFSIGDKLKVSYELEKGIAYYWNKYKLIVLILIGLISLIFLRYVYTKLTRREG
ncbi:hypothetical protein JCM9492_07650 [Aquifex pyrophilus]